MSEPIKEPWREDEPEPFWTGAELNEVAHDVDSMLDALDADEAVARSKPTWFEANILKALAAILACLERIGKRLEEKDA